MSPLRVDSGPGPISTVSPAEGEATASITTPVPADQEATASIFIPVPADQEATASITIPVPAEQEISASIIIPVYNEENAIIEVIKDVHASLSNTYAYEIIVVDDGSIDKTSQILKRIGGITHIRHHRNMGYGAALKTGITNATGKAIVIIDGDGTYPSENIPKMLESMVEFEMVVGARASNDRNIPFIRRPVKWLLGKLANYLSEADIPDLNSGLRAFKKESAMRFYKILPSGFSFTTTITLAMHCNGYKVKYIPIYYRKRSGKSKFRPISDTINFLQLMLRTIMYFNPIKIFFPIASILFLAFAVAALYDIFILRNVTDKTIIIFLAFVNVSLIGLLSDLIVKRSL